MLTRRSLLPVVFLSLPILLPNCSEEAADDDGAAGTGNTMMTGGKSAGGSSGSAGSGTSGAGTGGSGTAGTTSGSSGGGAGPTAGSAGSGGSVAGGGGNGGTGGSGIAGSTAGTGGSVGGGGTGGGASGAGAGGSSGGGAGGNGGTAGALGGAGSGGATGGSAGSGGGSGGSGGGGDFAVTSSKLAPNMMMPDDYTCKGMGYMPPLDWANAPSGTMSFAMVFVDTTIIDVSPTDSRGFHYAIWDMPVSTTGIPEHLPKGSNLTTPITAKQFSPVCSSNGGYLGPCAGHEDEYEFRVYALPVATLSGNLNSVLNIYNAIMAANPLAEAALHIKANATGTLKCTPD